MKTNDLIGSLSETLLGIRGKGLTEDLVITLIHRRARLYSLFLKENTESKLVLSIKDINWEKLREEILGQKSFIDKYGDECKEISLGKVSDLTPSGKHRDFGRPARNLDTQGSYKGYMRAPELLTRPIDKAEQKDSDWWRNLIEEGKKYGIYIRPSSDKNRTFIMVGIKIKDRSET